MVINNQKSSWAFMDFIMGQHCSVTLRDEKIKDAKILCDISKKDVYIVQDKVKGAPLASILKHKMGDYKYAFKILGGGYQIANFDSEIQDLKLIPPDFKFGIAVGGRNVSLFETKKDLEKAIFGMVFKSGNPAASIVAFEIKELFEVSVKQKLNIKSINRPKKLKLPSTVVKG